MPKYKPETAKAKAKLLIKSYIRNGLNQSELAKELGVTSEAVNQRLHHNSPVRPLIQSALEKAFKKIGISTNYKARKFKELLEQKKLQDCDIFIKDENGKLKVNRNSNDFIEVEDGNVRLGALKLLCQVQGDIDKGPLVDQSRHTNIVIKVEGIDGDKIPASQCAITSIQR